MLATAVVSACPAAEPLLGHVDAVIPTELEFLSL